MIPRRFAKICCTLTTFTVLAATLVKSPRVHADDRDQAGDIQSSAAGGSAARSPTGKNPRLVPDSVRSSKFRVRLDFVGRMPSSGNLTSPAIAGSRLLLIDQWGHLDAWDGAGSYPLLSSGTLPAGITPISSEVILNAAANTAGTTVYLIFTSTTVPNGIPQFSSPRPDANAWQVLYQFDFNGTALSNPRGIAAFESRSDNHTGGGLTVLSDGTLLLAKGENGDPGEDGHSYSQDPTNHLGKLLRINAATGATQTVALGLRNVQRIAVDPNGGDAHLVFADIGGWVAEELDAVRLTDLLASGSPYNFGWARNLADSKAREGTFYIDPAGTAVGVAPSPESGFLQPVAQFGREGAPAIAASGPVTSSQSFNRIRALFGDLVSGSVYAITGPPSVSGQTVFRVGLVDSASQTVTLKGLAGGNRADPRFFNFPDGTAGVLLESTGDFFRLTEVR